MPERRMAQQQHAPRRINLRACEQWSSRASKSCRRRRRALGRYEYSSSSSHGTRVKVLRGRPKGIAMCVAGGGRSGHFLSAIAVVAKDADAREASIEALGDGARHSWRLPGDLLVASSRLRASPILTPSSNRSLWRARGGRGERRVLSQGIKAGRHGRHLFDLRDGRTAAAFAASQPIAGRRRLRAAAGSPGQPGRLQGARAAGLESR